MTRREPGEPIAIVGMACRYPDAADPAQLWETVLHQRRAFRRLPPGRLDLADYWSADASVPDRTYSTQAAVLADWEFDREAFRIPGSTFRAADPAHWLALETADRALADAGHPAGAGLDADRVAVVVGNSLTGEMTRARTLRLRWPYVRDVLRSTLPEADLAEVEKRYLAAFPEVGDETLAGSLANTIAGRICNHFGFHGGGYTVDGACASSMLAVITACRALRDGGADFALAGGVDLSLDPFELVGFAKTGALAAEEMRIYDERSAGFWPGEGCGMLALARAEDARAAGLPVYAEILGWGVSSDGRGGITRPEADGQLLALRRAGEMAGIEHAEIGLYEGHGTGTAVGDLVELTALNRVRSGPSSAAALGSVKANIGHTKAAAGAAGVLKAALSVSSGLLPPTTGCATPHPALGETLRVLSAAEPWPEGRRFAGVSAMGFGGINTHVVLGTPTRTRPVRSPVADRSTPEFDVLAVSGPDPARVAAELTRIAEAAPRLSRAELHDLACQYGRQDAAGPVRAALVARTPAELGSLAARAAAEVPTLTHGRLSRSPGCWLGNAVPGRVALLFPGQGASGAEPADTTLAQPTIYRACASALARLDELGVTASAAIGHSLGELAALTWAGCLSTEDGERLAVERGRIMGTYGRPGTGMLAVAASAAEAQALCTGTDVVLAADNSALSQVLSGSVEELRMVADTAEQHGFRVSWLPVSHGFHSPAMVACIKPWRAFLKGMALAPVRRTMVSTVHGRPLTEEDDLVELLVRQLCAPVQFRAAVQAVDADLFVEAGPGRALSALAGRAAVSLDIGEAGDRASADSAAALFAAGAVADLVRWFAGRAARPIELDREPEFLTNPCSAAPSEIPAPREALDAAPARDAAATITGLLAEATELDAALIGSDARLLADLNLSSLRATQLVVEAASALGRKLPSVSMAFADSSVGEVIAEIERLPETAEPDAETPGVRPWTGCFAEVLAPARPESWRPTETVCLADPEDVEALLDAGRKALHRQALVVVTHDCAISGFFRSLHQEHPGVGITLAQVPAGTADFSALHAEPGRFRELVLGEDGAWYEPREQLVAAKPDDILLGDQDVLLVSGGGKGIGYECAHALAGETGLALAVLGRSHPETDDLLRANLDRLRADGIRVAYEAADVGDLDAVALAVEKLTAETGPVTALLHASGINEPARFSDLTPDRIRAHLRPKVTGLRALLAAVPPGSLRLLVTFGSVIGSAGMAGECHYALANGLLRAEARRLARELPSCRVLDIAWSAWSGAGMAERMGAAQVLARSGAAPIPVEEGTGLFLRLLRTPSTPADVSVHGRLGAAFPAGTGRFLERIRAGHPGVELVADATLSLRTEPWLDGHRVDGAVLLPAVVGLEAMAQAASTVAGRALTTASDVRFDRPVVIPDTGEHVVRVCALRDGDVITTVLRCAESAFQTDHFTATFPLSCNENTAPSPAVADHGRIEPAELYDRLLFHNGPFRRVTAAAVPDPWSCRAAITPNDEPWFASVLGDPAAHDATVHVLQSCVPTRRLLPVACDRVDFDPRATGPRELRGTEQHAADGRYTWDVVATDANGRTAVHWTGLRLADTGALPDDRPWPSSLLSVAITRTAVALGLDPSLRVSIGEPFTVDAGSSCPAACAWEFVEPRESPDARLLRVLSGPCDEPPERLAARASTVTRCLTQVSASPSEARFSGAYEGGWLVLAAGDARIASAVFTVDGYRLPIAIALLTVGGVA
ncbi:type I polyketide synthase [Amycolatopsis dendrobii]|uniref:SDR family NAD(P)-dependent oxidoreductase n=1 Tax=Amycolatopsis dendrobii TaxID=2760662 RepID=A0A7W3ZEU5_9PSEU|nr:type I polyketide synthase [Amycolatopsis dendrobii]MBB1158309.1 SDR family NAD(P)-dependent oxidoreductase [Amycolatopsis dendrobii]